MSDLTINEKEIGLWRLKTELAELMAFRQDEELDAEARGAIDAQIKAYVSAELRKVDNVSSFIRYRRSGASEARTEAKRLSSLADSWERDEEYLLGLVKDLMVEFKETKLEGRYGYLKLQANGGNQVLDIYNKELLPEAFVDYQVRMDAEHWSDVISWARESEFGVGHWLNNIIVERLPKSGALRETLSRKCALCEGSGLADPVNPSVDRMPCPACEGSGSAALVSGARLEPRGQHVRIK